MQVVTNKNKIMKIETKFNLGQKVFTISKYSSTKIVDCEDCKGIGEVLVESLNVNVDCPTCNGAGYTIKESPAEWKVNESSRKIGKIQVDVYRPTFHKSHKDKIMYMMDETGVGSGTNHYEENIFANLKEAEAECEKRNLTE